MQKGKTQKSCLGKALTNDKVKKKKQSGQAKNIHYVDKEKKEEVNKKSVIDQNTLEEFLINAELAQRTFEGEKNFKIVKTTKFEPAIVWKDYEKSIDVRTNEEIKFLRIPRRPKWDHQASKEIFKHQENNAFLEWRRDLAKFEEANLNIILTPFEKNIEIWRQLWLVIEKSHILIQIVDARDPLTFRCEDLELYVKEVDEKKKTLLLLNKSDLVDNELRKIWSEYFNQKKIDHIFFSAKKEQEIIDNNPTEIQNESSIETPTENTEKIFTVDNLMKFIQKKFENQNENTVIGMVGFPNVGKSSVINVLCKKKLVGVASMPGKTKHLQTLILDKHLTLCDCPGLVFPSISTSRGEMVCNGILPIDNLRDYHSPVQIICQRIPKELIESCYNIKISATPKTNFTNARDFLQAYALQRGFFSGSGLPDEARSARFILKDYVGGKITYIKFPPNYEGEKIINYAVELAKSIENKGEQSLPKEEIKEETKKDEILEEMLKPANPNLTQQEIEDLLQGKKVNGYKLTKDKRREIKFALKRGDYKGADKLLKQSLITV